jgi:hypothetical protein
MFKGRSLSLNFEPVLRLAQDVVSPSNHGTLNGFPREENYGRQDQVHLQGDVNDLPQSKKFLASKENRL